MPTVTFTPVFKDAPKEGKVAWKFKDTNGLEIWAKPDLPMMEKNQTYEVSYKISHGSNGKSFNFADAIKPLASANPTTGATGGGGNTKFDKNMFITAMMKSSIEAGLVPLESDKAIATVKMWEYVYDSTLGNPQQAEDMDDAIPF